MGDVHRREGGSKKVSFTRERTAVGSNPLGNEKTNGSGPVRNRVRSATFPRLCLPFILSLHDTRTRRPLDRCLLGRHRDVYIARTAGIERSASFKRRLRLYLKKRKVSFPRNSLDFANLVLLPRINFSQTNRYNEVTLRFNCSAIKREI